MVESQGLEPSSSESTTCSESLGSDFKSNGGRQKALVLVSAGHSLAAQLTLSLKIDPSNPATTDVVTVEVKVTGSREGQAQCQVQATNGFNQRVRCKVNANTDVAMGTFPVGSHSVTVQVADDGTVLDTRTKRFEVGGARPDLAVNRLRLDQNRYEAGEKVTLTYTITNAGGPTSGDVRVEARLDGLLVEARDATVDRPITTTTYAPSHSGEMVVSVGPSDAVDEANEANNTASVELDVRPARIVDLAWNLLSIGTPTVTPTDTLRYAYDLELVGTPGTSFDLDASIDGRVIESHGFAGTSGTREVKLGQLGLLPGTHRLELTLDSSSEVQEDDESNNTISADFEVVASGGADFVPGAIKVRPRRATIEDDVKISFKVKNKGEPESRSVRCTLHVDDELVGSRICSQGQVVRFDLPTKYKTPGVHIMIVQIDAKYRVPEKSEANNSKTSSLIFSDPNTPVDFWIDDFSVVTYYNPAFTEVVAKITLLTVCAANTPLTAVQAISAENLNLGCSGNIGGQQLPDEKIWNFVLAGGQCVTTGFFDSLVVDARSASASATQTVASQRAPPLFSHSAYVNHDCQVAESNEANNLAFTLRAAVTIE